ncbi:hypothetical protein HZH68_009865 [Vespula germanica]|uniref:Uncharacterized protein n=1 Tax=Vespula germanica TaxID=30212 RepID=A0A834JX89_VESGE|nr:hypothetical protein HZH68_009865 [Vespula germanica]
MVHGPSEIGQLEGLLFSIATFSGWPGRPMVGVVFVSSNEPMTLQRRRRVDKERRKKGRGGRGGGGGGGGHRSKEAAGFESKGGSESVTLSNTSVERIEGNSCRARLIAVQRDPALRVFAPQQQNEKQSNEQ